MGEEVETLEDHADLGTPATYLAFAKLVETTAAFCVPDERPVHVEPTRIDLLEVVDATQEGRLARPGRPEEAHHLAGRDLEGDPLQHLEQAVALVDGLGTDHRSRHLRPAR